VKTSQITVIMNTQTGMGRHSATVAKHREPTLRASRQMRQATQGARFRTTIAVAQIIAPL
jgi:hypothetical protein